MEVLRRRVELSSDQSARRRFERAAPQDDDRQHRGGSEQQIERRAAETIQRARRENVETEDVPRIGLELERKKSHSRDGDEHSGDEDRCTKLPGDDQRGEGQQNRRSIAPERLCAVDDFCARVGNDVDKKRRVGPLLDQIAPRAALLSQRAAVEDGARNPIVIGIE